ncbi:MAG: xanthine dehydrogenase family protein molybdopterin-binding subunit [Planctomycetaceae bacterium]|nr:xanthine dehydrogenase family protein molybdopterin-binding subunit [Planctomycetaceae bacterium]
MAERKIAWPPRSEASLIGGRHVRKDGHDKSSGAAKYAADINTEGTLYVKALTCRHAHAKVVKLDVEAAKKVKGVHAVHVFRDVDSEVRWDGTLIAAVAAERPEYAEDGVNAIRVEYEVLEHWVDEEDLAGAEKAERTRSLGENEKGDVAAALKQAKAVHKGYYGIATISHMCMEPHGSHCEWTGDGELTVHLSTQNVSGTGGQFAGPLGLDASKVRLICNYIGGGFGSKFAADEWGLAAATMAKETGRPVRFMLDRPTELKTAGTRPSGFAEVTIAADAEGNIIAWDSHHWGTSGIAGSTIALSQFPYVFDFENRNRKATGISTNTGPNRAWRAPPHPQLCALTDTAIDDLAAKLGMDSYDVFMKNLKYTPRPEVYAEEMKIGAKLIDWKKNWHLHGKGGGKGAVRRGLGMALHQWGGRAHAANTLVKVHPDGTVETFGGSQDIGTGTRTIIAITVAETFGLPLDAVKVNLGSNAYPNSGPSGGSTTVGGVSGPNRRAAQEALWKIFDLVTTKYDVEADSLTAKDGKILSNGELVCTWKQATSLLGPMALEVKGEGPKDDGLTDSGVGGVQMADVSVDTETGVVRVNKLVAVQDCGLILDLLTAESQVYGGLIMGIAYGLTEERVMDNRTGRYINADLENYHLPRIGDIGELVVEMYQPDDEYARGVIGLGEPPVISTGAALSNAVANAIGVRVPVMPLTPQRVLEALKGGQS